MSNIVATIKSLNLDQPINNIKLMVDTGAQTTSQSMRDTRRYRIDIFKYKKHEEKIQGIGGEFEFYELPHCHILLTNHNSNDECQHQKKLDMIQMFYEPNYNKECYGTAVSVVRIDILENIRFLLLKLKSF